MNSFKKNKNLLWISIGVCIFLAIITYICRLRSGTTWFAIAAVAGLSAQTAYKDFLFRWNPIRQRYRAKDKLDEYRKHAIVLMHILVCIGVFKVLKEIALIIIKMIK